MRINGEPVPRGQHLLAVTITTAIDRIATARLTYQDGAASRSDFALSSGELMVPGNEVTVSAGASDAAAVLFTGIIVKQSLKVRGDSAPQLIVEAKHKAARMAVARNSRVFIEQKDSDVIEGLFGEAEIPAEIAVTDVTQKQLVQYQCTDWNFCLARARANSMHLITREEKVLLAAIDPSGDSKADLLFGATVLDADFQMDARFQYADTSAITWDIANQELDEQDGEDPALDSPGNLSSSDLAQVIGLKRRVVRHPQITSDEAEAWASATFEESEASRVEGRVKCEGIGTIHVGDVVTLAGVGERFNGKAVVTGVRQQFDTTQGWKTHLQFGGIEPLESIVPAMSAPRASALLPAIAGLQIGIVVSNEDPDGEDRVRVKMPLIDTDDEGAWARVACLDAGDERGTFFRPEVGDEVVLGFLNDDPRAPVILGMLHSSAKPAPIRGSDDNNEKTIQTRSKMKWLIDDDKVEMSFETPAGNRLLLSEAEQTIVLEDQHGNRLVLDQSGIAFSSTGVIKLESTTDLELNSSTAIRASAGTQLKLEGGAGAELSSAAQTAIKGAIVQIN